MNYTLAAGRPSIKRSIGQAPRCHCWATDHQIHEQNDRANGPDGRSRQNDRMGGSTWLACTSSGQHRLQEHHQVNTTALVTQPDTVNQGITNQSTPFEILTLQAETKTLQKEFDLQEAVINIRVQCIIDCVEEQYTKELNEEYFGYANRTIKSVLHHLRTKWCKIMTRECMDANDAFYQTWVPNMTHIITFGCQLNKQQKNAKQ
jgi:hypothetical protein